MHVAMSSMKASLQRDSEEYQAYGNVVSPEYRLQSADPTSASNHGRSAEMGMLVLAGLESRALKWQLTLISLCSNSAVCMYFSALNTCMPPTPCQ